MLFLAQTMTSKFFRYFLVKELILEISKIHS